MFDHQEEKTLFVDLKKINEQNQDPKGMYLIVVHGNLMGMSIKVTDGLIIGRSPDAGFRLYDESVSRNHVQFSVPKMGAVMVKDLDSSNGTFVNGKRIQSRELKTGDRIRIGLTTVFKFSQLDGIEDSLQQLRKTITRKLREHEDDITLFTEILQVSPEIFSAFSEEANVALRSLEIIVKSSDEEVDLVTAKRAVHTLKGNSRSLGLNYIGGRAHAVEEVLEHFQVNGASFEGEDLEDLMELLDDLRRALGRAAAIFGRLSESVSTKSEAGFDLSHYDSLTEVFGLLQSVMPMTEHSNPLKTNLQKAVRILAKHARVELKTLLQFLSSTARTIAQNAAREIPEIQVSGGELSVFPSTYRALTAALPHLIRNAVVHGIEPATVRATRGKSKRGKISIIVDECNNRVRIRIRDDGQGLPLDKLRAKAKEANLTYSEDPKTLAELLFLPGMSTKEGVDLDGGRGFGTTAAKAAIAAVGGQITVQSIHGMGTEFCILL